MTAIPGPNAAVTALILSGLPPLPFMFLGFPPPEAGRAPSGVQQVCARPNGRDCSATLVWHEAPHRLLETLADLQDVFGDRNAAVARELTKRFETVERGKVSDLTDLFTREPPRGEITLLIGPPETEDPEDLDGRLRAALATQTVKDAAALVSAATGLPRKMVYARALQIHEEAVDGSCCDGPVGGLGDDRVGILPQRLGVRQQCPDRWNCRSRSARFGRNGCVRSA